MIRPLRPFWSYYGSKYALAPLYPRPQHPLLVEPFAGGAAYALHYPDLQVLLIDKDPVIAGLWQYLIRVSESEILALRDDVDDVTQLGPVAAEARWLVGFWLGRCRATPLQAGGAWLRQHRRVRPASFWGAQAKRRIASQLRYIRHWRALCGEYRDAADRPATWFVDPPYLTKGGRRYREGSTGLDYAALGAWCRTRPGQVLVCEQAGAAWLPFERLRRAQGMRGFRDEVVWTPEPRAGVQLELRAFA
ncbi:MAG: hypothetical protein U1A78_33580 [Polyangia bacterium]